MAIGKSYKTDPLKITVGQEFIRKKGEKWGKL